MLIQDGQTEARDSVARTSGHRAPQRAGEPSERQMEGGLHFSVCLVGVLCLGGSYTSESGRLPDGLTLSTPRVIYALSHIYGL